MTRTAGGTLFIAEATINGRDDGYHTIGVFSTEAKAKAALGKFLTMLWGQYGWVLEENQYHSPFVEHGLQAGIILRFTVDQLDKSAVSAAVAHGYWRLRDGGHYRKDEVTS